MGKAQHCAGLAQSIYVGRLFFATEKQPTRKPWLANRAGGRDHHTQWRPSSSDGKADDRRSTPAIISSR